MEERGQRGMDGAGAGAVLHFLYGPDGGLLAEYDAGTGAVTREYVTLAGRPLALVAEGRVLAVHADHLGTPQAMTDAAGTLVWQAALRPFGEGAEILGTAANDQRFPGQYFDAETGLHQNWFRDYDPSLGRYLQVDPIGLAGGLNLYAYVNGNPVNFIDPGGLQRGSPPTGFIFGKGFKYPGRPSPMARPLWSPGKQGSPAANAHGHYRKHGSEFPEFRNALEYARGANKFRDKLPQSTLTKSGKFGQTAYYDPKSNTLLICERYGIPRTFYRPNPAKHGRPTNMDYWNDLQIR